jgi:hypothetical protein
MLVSRFEGRRGRFLGRVCRSGDRLQETVTQSDPNAGRRHWRIALLLLVLLPLLPEILILAVSAAGSLAGCLPGSDQACAAGPVHASDLLALSLLVASWVAIGFGFGVAAFWLAACYLAISRGWQGLAPRLVIALVVSLAFAALPYLGPMFSILPLVNPRCLPNEGGVGDCMIYGGEVGDAAHSAIVLPWMMFLGAPIALAAFVIYAAVLMAGYFAARRRAVPQVK